MLLRGRQETMGRKDVAIDPMLQRRIFLMQIFMPKSTALMSD